MQIMLYKTNIRAFHQLINNFLKAAIVILHTIEAGVFDIGQEPLILLERYVLNGHWNVQKTWYDGTILKWLLW